jgi:single-strand DNA-binding protein
MNKVILNGNLCKDIELKYTQNNIAVVSNTIAVKNDFKNAKGETESQFINFVVYRNNAEFLKKYAAKGSKVLLEGRLNNRSYDKQDGTKAYITEVVVERIELLGNKPVETKQEQTKEEDPFAVFGNTVEVNDNFLE